MTRRSSVTTVWTLVGLTILGFWGSRLVAQWSLDESTPMPQIIVAGPEPFLGQIQAFGFNFAPRGWALCEGQLLSISENSALFSLLGTTYGGDGRTTFGLPDLRGRAAIGMGQGAGLTDRRMGARGGVETVTLNVNQMPAHNHEIFVEPGDGDTGSPTGNVLARAFLVDRRDNQYAALPDPAVDTLDIDAVSFAGSGQSHENMAPFVTINYCIALEGVFPSRN